MILVAAARAAQAACRCWDGWRSATAAGIGYGVWGLRLTRFENRRRLFFTPNARLGMVIAMLFMARVMYIGFEMYANRSMAPTPALPAVR